MSDTYFESETVEGSGLVAEYDDTFDGDTKANNLLKITSDAFTREFRTIKIKEIGFTDPVKKGRTQTMIGLTATVRDLGVLTPIHVMTVEDPDDDYKYVLLEGLRRIYAAAKNGQEEIDAIVWDFKDKDKGSELSLYLTLILSRTQKRSWAEIWHLYQVLEMQSAITPGTLEYLLQLEAGDAMKLKDVMLCGYDEVKDALMNNEKNLDACYKMLTKLRKEEDTLSQEDATGAGDTVEGAEDLASNNTGSEGQLSDQDVLELLEMVDDLDNVGDVDEDDFKELNSSAYEAERQKVGERHPIDPALRQAVLGRDNFTCMCCGMRMVGARLGLIAIHHILPVHTGGKDTMDNLATLCVNDHLALHIMERNGGSILMSKEDFEALDERDQISLKKARKLALIAIEADKRKGLSKEQVADATLDSIRHPMPGAGLSENQTAYAIAKNDVKEHSVEQPDEEPQEVPEDVDDEDTDGYDYGAEDSDDEE